MIKIVQNGQRIFLPDNETTNITTENIVQRQRVFYNKIVDSLTRINPLTGVDPLGFTMSRTTKNLNNNYMIEVVFTPNFPTNLSNVTIQFEISGLLRKVQTGYIFPYNQQGQNKLFDCSSGGSQLVGRSSDFKLKYLNLDIDYVLNFSTDSAFIISDAVYLEYSIFAGSVNF